MIDNWRRVIDIVDRSTRVECAPRSTLHCHHPFQLYRDWQWRDRMQRGRVCQCSDHPRWWNQSIQHRQFSLLVMIDDLMYCYQQRAKSVWRRRVAHWVVMIEWLFSADSHDKSCHCSVGLWVCMLVRSMMALLLLSLVVWNQENAKTFWRKK